MAIFAWLRDEAGRLARLRSPLGTGRIALVGEELATLRGHQPRGGPRRRSAPWPSSPRWGCPRSSFRSPELEATSKPPTRGSSPTRAPPCLSPEADLTPDRLVREVTQLLAQPERLRTMAGHACALATPDAAERLVDLVLALTRDASERPPSEPGRVAARAGSRRD